MAAGLQLPISEELIKTFNDSKDSGVRLIQAEIVSEQVVLVSTSEEGEVELTSLLKDGNPTYFLIKSEDSWVLVSYVPDTCKVRQRMLYASTADHLRKTLGTTNVTTAIHCTDKAELSAESIRQAVQSKKGGSDVDARTRAEIEKDEERKQVVAEGVTKSYVHSVQIAFSETATVAVKEMIDSKVHALILALEDDKIGLEAKFEEPITVEELATKITNKEPRFVIFRFVADHEGEETNNNVFVYLCPEGCKVKLRMVYSTTKASVISTASDLGLNLDKKLEYGEVSDLTTEGIYNSIYPPEVQDSKKFSKPARPGKGKARVTE